ncbi:proton-conducting transporter transmembrane domain-containing protein [Crenalkalicoccus roseus]|uniref:proton-conducting transporter transmembrane domain-containing protein n=1 Tax=Crenalkalicoccus roseus TaxID=1485588 RepID=UPI001081AD33|nr:proton-conducting transporter membrane subunit [Crenalkalicoccus roseus]
MLTALASLVGLLVLLAAAAVPLGRRRQGGAVVHGACLAAAALLALLAAAALAVGPPEAPLRLPLGPPWSRMVLALDGLSAWFLLLLGLSGAAASLFALGHPPGPARTLPPYPLFLAGMALTLLAADAFTLLFGFELMSLASWALVAAEHQRAESRRAARLYLVFAAFSALCLIPAFGLLAGPTGALEFATLRTLPPEGARGAAVLALALLGAGAKAGLVPLHAWLPLAHPAAPSHVSALMSGVMTKVALYVLARLVLDLCGPAQPSWWGLPLLALGAASALLGALRAALEEDAKALLACSTIENVGLITIGLGLALVFRGADLAALAALALSAALLHALNHGVFKTLLFLAAGAVAHAAGSRALGRLGGLVHAMPVTAACALVGALAAAALPPLSGFAGEWLLLQALIAGWRVADIAFQVAIAATLALAAMAAALAAAAMVRLFGVAFLGRPRTPRGAGAHEVSAPERWAMILPAGLTVLLGLFPAPVLRLAEPAIAALAGPVALAPARGLSLWAGDGATAYLPLVAAALLALAGAALAFAVRRRSPLPAARGPAWDCGFIAPPAHLPFGDPLTQPGPAGIAQPLRRMLGEALLRARERVDMPEPGETRPARHAAGFRDPSLPLLLAPAAWLRERLADQGERLRHLTIRRWLSLSFATLVALLALLAWLEAR